ncbi:MAG TPA: hypothetical protein DCP28_25445 [Cytophagales bacterium]|nr:hypothetical protein [Cytophagales bacterium]
MNDRSEMDNRLRDRFSNWEASPPPRGWDRLQGPLVQQRLGTLLKRTRLMALAILLLLIPAGYGTWHFLFFSHGGAEGVREVRQVSIKKGEKVTIQDRTIAAAIPQSNTITNATTSTQAVESTRPTDRRWERTPSQPDPAQETILIPNAEEESPPVILETPPGGGILSLSSLSTLPHLGPWWAPFGPGQFAIQVQAPEAPKKVIDPKPKPRPWEGYVSVLPLLNYSQIQPNKEDEIFMLGISGPSMLALERLGYRAAVGAEIPIARTRWQINAEVAYTLRQGAFNYQYQLSTPDEIIAEQQDDNTTVLKPLFSNREGSYEYRTHAAGVQVGLNYLISGVWADHRLTAGYEAAVFTNQNPFGSGPGVSQIRDLDLIQQHLVTVGYRMDYSLSRNFSARFQPSLRYALQSSEVPSGYFSLKPVSYGLSVGLAYRFGK